MWIYRGCAYIGGDYRGDDCISKIVLGVILSQKDENNKEYSIIYNSKVFTKYIGKFFKGQIYAVLRTEVLHRSVNMPLCSKEKL